MIDDTRDAILWLGESFLGEECLCTGPSWMGGMPSRTLSVSVAAAESPPGAELVLESVYNEVAVALDPRGEVLEKVALTVMGTLRRGHGDG